MDFGDDAQCFPSFNELDLRNLGKHALWSPHVIRREIIRKWRLSCILSALVSKSGSGGRGTRTWFFSAHVLRSSKFLQVCFVLKSGNALGLSWLNHTWPRTPVSAVHIRTWRKMSRQCAVGELFSALRRVNVGSKRHTYTREVARRAPHLQTRGPPGPCSDHSCNTATCARGSVIGHHVRRPGGIERRLAST